jgi:hypothetical protein
MNGDIFSLVMQAQFAAILGTVSASLPGSTRTFSRNFDAFNLQVDLFDLFTNEADEHPSRHLAGAEDELTGILAYCAEKNMTIDNYFLSNVLTAVVFMLAISFGQYLLGVGMRLYYANYAMHTGSTGGGDTSEPMHKRRDSAELYIGTLAYPAPQFAGAILVYQGLTQSSTAAMRYSESAPVLMLAVVVFVIVSVGFPLVVAAVLHASIKSHELLIFEPIQQGERDAIARELRALVAIKSSDMVVADVALAQAKDKQVEKLRKSLKYLGKWSAEGTKDDPTYLEHRSFRLDAVSLKDILCVVFDKYTEDAWWMVLFDFAAKLWIGIGTGTGMEERAQSCWLMTAAAINCVLFVRYRLQLFNERGRNIAEFAQAAARLSVILPVLLLSFGHCSIVFAANMMLIANLCGMAVPLIKTLTCALPLLYKGTIQVANQCRQLSQCAGPSSLPTISALGVDELRACLPNVAAQGVPSTAADAVSVAQQWYIGSYLQVFYQVVPGPEVLAKVIHDEFYQHIPAYTLAVAAGVARDRGPKRSDQGNTAKSGGGSDLKEGSGSELTIVQKYEVHELALRAFLESVRGADGKNGVRTITQIERANSRREQQRQLKEKGNQRSTSKGNLLSFRREGSKREGRPVQFDELEEGLRSSETEGRGSKAEPQAQQRESEVLQNVDKEDASTYLQDLVIECTAVLLLERLTPEVKAAIRVECDAQTRDQLPGLEEFVLGGLEKGIKKGVQRMVQRIFEAGTLLVVPQRDVDKQAAAAALVAEGGASRVGGGASSGGGARGGRAVDAADGAACVYGVSSFVSEELLINVEEQELQDSQNNGHDV